MVIIYNKWLLLNWFLVIITTKKFVLFPNTSSDQSISMLEIWTTLGFMKGTNNVVVGPTLERENRDRKIILWRLVPLTMAPDWERARCAVMKRQGRGPGGHQSRMNNSNWKGAGWLCCKVCPIFMEGCSPSQPPPVRILNRSSAPDKERVEERCLYLWCISWSLIELN